MRERDEMIRTDKEGVSESEQKYTELSQHLRKKDQELLAARTKILELEVWMPAYVFFYVCMCMHVLCLCMFVRAHTSAGIYLSFLCLNVRIDVCKSINSIQVYGYCDLQNKWEFQRFSTAALYQSTAGTPSERFLFILQVSVQPMIIQNKYY